MSSRVAGVEAGDLLAVARGVAGKEVCGEEGDVFAAFAQGGQVDFDGVEAEEEVFAEAAFGGFDAEVGVGGGEHADVDPAGLR